MANPGEEWSAAEVSETVADYLAMLCAETAGRHYSKAAHRRVLQTKLSASRTPQAIEFKHANISAAMIELGLPYIRGYKPRGNYQAELVSEIQRRVVDPKLLAALRTGPGASALRMLRPADPPPPPPRKRVGRHVDYGLLQEENRRLGAVGEQLVLEFERRRLASCGQSDLADRVRWAARDDGDGLGYDILSFGIDGRDRYIEVKTTALDAQTPFYISSAELEFARAHPDSFVLYRVYDACGHPHFYVLDGDIAEAAELVPITYRGQLKDNRSQPTRMSLNLSSEDHARTQVTLDIQPDGLAVGRSQNR